MTMDPLAEKYYSVSPYAYCGNNPINRIDPDGMDDYTINQNGYIELFKKTKDEIDRLIALGEAGKVKYDKKGNMTNNFITISDTKLLPTLSSVNKDDGSNVVTSNGGDAFNVFKFAADNSNVEWSLSGFKENNQIKFYLNTQHNDSYANVGDGGDFFKTKDMAFNVHSHPKENGTKGGSGYNYNPDGKLAYYAPKSDGSNAARYHRLLGEKMPNLYLYHRYTKGLYQYTPWNHAANKWLNIQSGKRLNNIINH